MIIPTTGLLPWEKADVEAKVAAEVAVVPHPLALHPQRRYRAHFIAVEPGGAAGGGERLLGRAALELGAPDISAGITNDLHNWRVGAFYTALRGQLAKLRHVTGTVRRGSSNCRLSQVLAYIRGGRVVVEDVAARYWWLVRIDKAGEGSQARYTGTLLQEVPRWLPAPLAMPYGGWCGLDSGGARVGGT